ncbi:uncharacterized protein ARMOST_20404 [Armillaria ostoyae]|uniref:Uncharacterized protein n=1 Tax=Armillaria ostoyae TaxID=47428 RepID=A0A284S7A4_ARMOS|nr:uncharacterized protein ARMOST_20404 [Armillaria ostoyae]
MGSKHEKKSAPDSSARPPEQSDTNMVRFAYCFITKTRRVGSPWTALHPLPRDRFRVLCIQVSVLCGPEGLGGGAFSLPPRFLREHVILTRQFSASIDAVGFVCPLPSTFSAFGNAKYAASGREHYYHRRRSQPLFLGGDDVLIDWPVGFDPPQFARRPELDQRPKTTPVTLNTSSFTKSITSVAVWLVSAESTIHRERK